MTTKKAAAAPTDLAEFDAIVQKQSEGILVPILSMDGRSPLGFSIRVAGPDSERSQDALAAIQQELLEEQSLEPDTAAKAALRRMRYFTKVSMDFVPNERPDGTTPDVAIILDGAPLPFSEENALKLYQRFRFIYQQVAAKADTRVAFLDGSSVTSAKV